MANICAGLWKALTNLPVAKSNGWLMTDGRYLFYAGGATDADTTGTAEIYSALANGDGTIGSWKLAGAIPKHMAFFSGVIDGSYMVLAGGNTNSPVDSVYLGKLSSDGQVGSMTYLRTPISSFRNPGTVMYKGRVYYVGGNTAASGGKEVYVGTIAKQIQDSSWKRVTDMPVGLQAGVAFEHGGYLYYVGGSSTGLAAGASPYVYSVKILGDGTLDSAWKVVGQMPKGLHRLAAVKYKGKILILGGQDTTSTNSSALYWAPLQAGGGVGTFNTDELSLPLAHRNSCAAVIGNKLFLASGFTTGRFANVWSVPLSF